MSVSGAATAGTAVHAKSTNWRSGVAIGALGGLTLTAMESLQFPYAVTSPEFLQMLAQILPQWTIVGIAIALLALNAERTLSPVTQAAVFILFALLVAAALVALREAALRNGLIHPLSVLAGLPLEWTRFVYDLWVILFFGGLFMAACALYARVERNRDLHARAAIERARTETLLDAAQLRALEAQIDPEFLLRVMAEVARRYESDRRAADRLLDALVVFLRAAMPGLRGKAATLEDELALAVAYGKVWEELDASHARWRARIDAAARMPFPPFLLLPVLDRWMAAAPPNALAELRLERDGDATVIVLDDRESAAARWLGADLEYRLRVGLRMTFGERYALALDRAGPRAASLALRIDDRPASTSATPAESTGEVDARRVA